MTQNMFQFGDQNKCEVEVILKYLESYQSTGMCSYLNDYETGYDFLKSQEVFNKDEDFPVEYHVLTSKGNTKVRHLLQDEYEAQWNKSDPDTPYGQLRRWWCYNLAVAMSQGMC